MVRLHMLRLVFVLLMAAIIGCPLWCLGSGYSGGGGGGTPDGVKRLPSGWSDSNLSSLSSDNVYLAGSGFYDPLAARYEFFGSGTGTGDTSDNGYFAYQSKTGDFDLRCKVIDIERTDGFCKTTLMVRESTGVGSKFVAIFLQPDSGVRAVSAYRTTTDGSGAVNDIANNNGLPSWLRIVRSGNNFSTYVSANGTSWTQVGTTVSVTMSDPVLVGVLVASNNTGKLMRAVLSDITVQ